MLVGGLNLRKIWLGFCSSLYSLLLVFSDSLWARWLTTTWNRLRETWKVWDVPVGLCVRNLNGMVANVFVFIAMSLPVVIMMYTTTIMANMLPLVKTVQLLRFLGSTVLGPRHTIPLASTTGSTASTNLTYGRLPVWLHYQSSTRASRVACWWLE